MSRFIKVALKPLRISEGATLTLTADQISSRRHLLSAADGKPLPSLKDLRASGKRLAVLVRQTVEFKAGEVIGASIDAIEKAFRANVEDVDADGNPVSVEADSKAKGKASVAKPAVAAPASSQPASV